MTQLFWRLSPEDQAKLMQYQFDNFGTKMNIPPPVDIEQTEWDGISESPEELDHLMRQKPDSPKQVK